MGCLNTLKVLLPRHRRKTIKIEPLPLVPEDTSVPSQVSSVSGPPSSLFSLRFEEPNCPATLTSGFSGSWVTASCSSSPASSLGAAKSSPRKLRDIESLYASIGRMLAKIRPAPPSEATLALRRRVANGAPSPFAPSLPPPPATLRQPPTGAITKLPGESAKDFLKRRIMHRPTIVPSVFVEPQQEAEELVDSWW